MRVSPMSLRAPPARPTWNFRRLGLALLLLAALPATAFAQAQGSGLPLPRFVSLRSDEVNLRSGPGVRYPVDWVYTRRDLPVEVIAEFEVWRKIRDWQGTEGWVHESMLGVRRMVVVTGAERRLRADADAKSPAVALLEPNVIGRLIACPHGKEFCKIEVANFQGWLKRDEFWGVYPGEYVE